MITSGKMREIEDLSEKYGVSKMQLMENAGKALFQEMERIYDLKNRRTLIICSHGNNGGDGFVLARYLFKKDYYVNVLFLGEEIKLKKESGYNYRRLRELDRDIFTEKRDFDQYDILVDAIFGTGINGKIREPYLSIIDSINKSERTVVSVDLPTGLDPDTGKILDKMVNANLIITFHDIKPGLEKYRDKVVVVDIGIPKEAVKSI